MVDTLSAEYKWTRNEVLDYPLDEIYFIIDKMKIRRKQEYMEKVNLHLIPLMEEKALKEFINSLNNDHDGNQPRKVIDTDFSEVEKIKQSMKSMNKK